MAKTFQCLIVQIEVSYLYFPFGERIQVNSKTVILGCDFHLSGRLVKYGMVAAPMSELQFVGFSSKRQT